MGLLSTLQTWLGVGKKSVNIVVVGLDNSGKTTILNSLRSDETKVAQVVPTVGLAVTTFSNPQINFTAFDMSGQGRYRNLWENYYAKSEGIIFVVDSTDRLRMSVARDELFMILEHKDVGKIPILVMANKSDLNDAMNSAEVMTILGLTMVRDRPFRVASTSAITMAGIPDALEWLSKEIRGINQAAAAGPVKR